ncbi:MAG: apolipoprotein N-acyltransferase [Fibrobacterota bacterium]
MSNRVRAGLAALSGLLLFLGHPPFSLWFFAPISLALLCGLWVTGTRKQAFISGLISGAVCNTGLLYWIPKLMQEGLVVALGAGMILFIAFQSLWPALTALLTRRAAEPYRTRALLLFPLLWTGQEKLRELGEMSFPWITTGYTYGGSDALIQALSIGGVHLYTFLIALSAVLLFVAFTSRKRPAAAAAPLLIVFLLHAGLFAYGTLRLRWPLTGKPLTVALLQSNVDSYAKWNRTFTDSIVELQLRMTREAAESGNIDLVVWAESALPAYFKHHALYRYRVQRLSDSLNLPLLFGSIDYETNKAARRGYDFFCSAFYVRPGLPPHKYDKMRLVPFGERLPFQGFFPLISRVDLGGGDFTPGRELRLFDLKGVRFFTPICYEVVYPDHIRAFARAGGQVMFEITNDGWYGRSGMPYQHMNIMRFRAVENGIPAAQCANTGITAFVDAYGRQSPAPDIYTRATVTRTLDVAPVTTFYRRHGDLVGWCCLFALILYLLSVVFRPLLPGKP